MLKTALVFDAVAAVIVLICIFMGVKKGFLSTIVMMVGQIAAIVVAIVLSGLLSSYIYSNFIEQKIINEMTDKIQITFSGESTAAATEIVTKATENLPGFISDKAKKMAEEDSGLLKNLDEKLGNSSKDAAKLIEDNIIQPIAEFALRIIMFSVMFIILMIIVRLLAKLLKAVNKIPLVGGANKALGAATGLLDGIIKVIILVYIIKFAVLISDNSIPVINDETISESYVFSQVYNADLPFMIE